MKHTMLKIAGAFLLSTLASVHADQYSIGWSTIAGGGGTTANGQYSLTGTIGQFEVGAPMAGGDYLVSGGFWQVPGGPALSIQLTAPNTLVISWSEPALGCFILQQANSLIGPTWTDVTAPVAFVNGVNQVTVSPLDGAQFFRLVSVL